jgi:hypothetical protein
MGGVGNRPSAAEVAIGRVAEPRGRFALNSRRGIVAGAEWTGYFPHLGRSTLMLFSAFSSRRSSEENEETKRNETKRLDDGRNGDYGGELAPLDDVDQRHTNHYGRDPIKRWLARIGGRSSIKHIGAA